MKTIREFAVIIVLVLKIIATNAVCEYYPNSDTDCLIRCSNENTATANVKIEDLYNADGVKQNLCKFHLHRFYLTLILKLIFFLKNKLNCSLI